MNNRIVPGELEVLDVLLQKAFTERQSDSKKHVYFRNTLHSQSAGHSGESPKNMAWIISMGCNFTG